MEAHHEGTKDTKSTKLVLDGPTEAFATQTVDAIHKVYRALGPGLLESAYETCLVHDLRKRGLQVETQKALGITFEDLKVEAAYRLDSLVENCIILELKAVEALQPVHEAQLLTYLRLSGRRLGFLVNFNAPNFKTALKRMVL
ncbi:MAG TPA: GxxExxY protein [Holophagaceae bacterium]|nr:GxxExxY protein [Holophagaceae bacterium]